MNIITDVLPECITVDGKEYPINSDFKVWIRFEKLILDIMSNPEQAVIEIFKLCFKRDKTRYKLPLKFDSTLKALTQFYTLKTEETEAHENNADINNAKRQRIYSYEYDSKYIYAAFVQQYGIDLCSCNMHWWKFHALMSSVSADTKFGEIMGIRALNLNDIKDKRQRAQYIKLKKIYALPDMRSEEEKENELADMFDM